MQVCHRGTRGMVAVEGPVQDELLRRPVTREVLPVDRRHGEPLGVEPTQARVRRRDHDLVVRPDAEVPRPAWGQPPVVQRGAELHHRGPHRAVETHDPATSSASRKNDGPPKFPDLKAIASPRSSATSHGTPTLMSGPIRADRNASDSATAPDVSPPATMNRRTPSPSSAIAMRPMV